MLVEELRTKKYDPDPVRAWKKQQSKILNEEEAENEEAEDGENSGPAKIGDYDYLLDMPIRSLTYEKKEELLRKKEAKMQEYEILRKKTPADLWREDLDAFLKALQEAEDEESEEPKKAVKKLPMLKGKKKLAVEEVMPSPKGAIHFPMVVPFIIITN